ncbi:GGDEF domain-containing phosphodiesterase [Halomonas sp. CSM-2]|uniref:GGDEF domain-containing phosphodiesterase n=1 Tax=Halomonas sp. CSM-2 TaxID=1975722 RepID=UPI0020CAEB7D|nr:GGDEF domain-containing phosphodiesterase [Halomonas sp. CSM-2]
MQARMAELSLREATGLPYRIRDVAMDVGLVMVAAVFILLGGTGLIGRLMGIAYPLSGLMVADAALTGFLAGLCLLGWLLQQRWLVYLAAMPLALITLYTLVHNGLSGGPWVGASWVSGGPRILSAAAFLLFLVALCTTLGTKQTWQRLVWAGSGVLALGTGSFSMLLLLLPDSRLGWADGFVSAPLLATLYALLGGVAFVSAAWRGSRPLLPLGWLTQIAVVSGVLVSCVAWYTLSWSGQGHMQRQAATLLDNAARNARHAMQEEREFIQRLAWRQGLNNTLNESEHWAHDVQTYFEHAPYLKTVALIGPDGELGELRVSPQPYPRRLLTEDSYPSLRDALFSVRSDTWALQVDRQPSTVLLVSSLGNNAGGQLVAELDMTDLLRRELSVPLSLFRLTVGEGTPYLALRKPGRAIDDTPIRPLPHLEERHVGLPGGARLTFNVYMDSVSGMLRAGIMPAGFAIAGLTLSYLLALSLGLVRLILFRSRELLSARQKLEAQYDLEQRYRSLYLYHPDGVLSIDREGRVVTANEACGKITGRANNEVQGTHFSTLLQPQDIERIQVIYDATLDGQPNCVELQIKHREGHLKSLELTTMPIIVDGETLGVFAIAKDITQQHEQAAQLAYQASHDLLTGLPNHTAFDDDLNEAFAEAQKNGKLLVVMHIDLDGFKAVNDGLGHHIGDLLLVAVAGRLRRAISQRDTLVRMTGDEFALLLTELDDCDAGIEVAEQVLDYLLEPFQLEGESVHISASIGIACNSDAVEHAHELMQQADIAMGEAKQQGRNTWHWYQGDVQRITRASVLLRHDLHKALQNDEFELYYQPIVEARSGRVQGMEALIRWHHPEKGMISPGTFIPLAEQTGQIIPLGRWILHRVCQDVAFMQATKGPEMPVAINISSLQFRRAGFLEDMQKALDDSGVPPERLEIEVTESVLIDGAKQAIDLINRLKAMGIKVALDDFGTGFSSLSYLRDLPIHKVKLDRAFIKDITTDTRNAAIVQGIITMAHHLNLIVVAEGIEDRAQQQDLIRRDCDLLQGFLFARPMPRDAVMALPAVLPASKA